VTDSTDLLRCWVEFDLEADAPATPTSRDKPRRGHPSLSDSGIGVTGYDEADCLALIKDLLDGEELPPILRLDWDVNVDALSVADEVGVPVWRGVWFPRLNLKPGNRPA
jgi:hypothetical protein